MRREEMTLDQAVERAASTGALVRHEVVSLFLEVLRLAVESQAIPDASTGVLGEDGTLSFAQAAKAEAADAPAAIRAACLLATRLFGAAQLDPPLALRGTEDTAPERFPTLPHLRDAFELELLLSGTPPPTEVERRMAIAALVAKARQLRGPSAGPARWKQPAPEQPASLGLAAAAGENAPPFAVPRWAPQRWVALVAAAAVGAAAGILLDRDAARRSVPSPVRVSEPTLDAVPPLPEVHAAPAPGKDSRAPGRERVAPPPSVPVSDPAPRPVRKLHRRAAAAADATAAARAKLQAGDESLKQGRFFEAVLAFREALEQDSPVPAAARRLGDAYRLHQDTALAVAAYERYLELEPSAPDTDEVRAAVEELRSATPMQ